MVLMDLCFSVDFMQEKSLSTCPSKIALSWYCFLFEGWTDGMYQTVLM
jgi:hypothetical protein